MSPDDFSPRQWEVIVLVGRDGMTWEEVAAHMGVSRGTIQNYVQRIRLRVPEVRNPRELMTIIYHRAAVV